MEKYPEKFTRETPKTEGDEIKNGRIGWEVDGS
jgi:hypothetical protein